MLPVRVDHWCRALSIAVVFFATAFIATSCWGPVRQHEWDSRTHGPLVPHRTFPGDCSLCHVGETWSQVRAEFHFDHDAQTNFALVGAHAGAQCLRCHNERGPVRDYAARGCSGCHIDVHDAALGIGCERCHDEHSWRPTGEISDHANTGFPLIGMHAIQPCVLCHTAADRGRFVGAPLACQSCHAQELSRATSPDHVAAGWTYGCDVCHTPTSWSASRFPHTGFPLSGAHAALDCSACHVGTAFGGLDRECYSCHAVEYLAQSDHVSLSFPTTCESCHATTAWSAVMFDHRFPISGPHRVDCIDCHTASTTATFDCLTCHSAGDMNDEHDEVTGYVYQSTACFSCHPNGRE